MGNVVSLRNYKKNLKVEWFKKNAHHLDAYLNTFMINHLAVSFRQVSSSYQNILADNYEAAWDYIDLRDHLYDIIEAAMNDYIFNDLKQLWWFDNKLISKEDITEYSLRLYIQHSL